MDVPRGAASSAAAAAAVVRRQPRRVQQAPRSRLDEPLKQLQVGRRQQSREWAGPAPSHLCVCGSHPSTWCRMSGCSADIGGGLLGSALQAARLPAPPLRALGLEAMASRSERKCGATCGQERGQQTAAGASAACRCAWRHIADAALCSVRVAASSWASWPFVPSVHYARKWTDGIEHRGSVQHDGTLARHWALRGQPSSHVRRHHGSANGGFCTHKGTHAQASSSKFSTGEN